MHTSNGSEILKQEIKDSEIRLQQVRSGISVADIVPRPDERFFLKDKEPYFKGNEKVLRRQERALSQEPSLEELKEEKEDSAHPMSSNLNRTANTYYHPSERTVKNPGFFITENEE